MRAGGLGGRGGAPPGPRRARGLPWRSARFASLDFETTGLNFDTDTIVSFGVVPVSDGRIQMRGSIHQLIDPHVPPTPRSQTIHGLRPQDLRGAPPLPDVLNVLRRALEGRVLLVWFADVEMHFLSSIFGGSGRRWRRRTIDVRNLAIAADGLPLDARSQPGYPLTATAERFGVPVADPHDAFDDALVTAQLFLVLATRLSGGSPSLRELMRAGRPT
jgi:DNA polymerase-3 subunit epsilon